MSGSNLIPAHNIDHMSFFGKRKIDITTKFASILLLAFLNIPFYLPAQSQELWEGSKFIEYPNAVFRTTTPMPQCDFEEFIEELQPKLRKRDVNNKTAVLEMTFVVYEAAAIGNKPFGRIRYDLGLEDKGDQLLWSFQNFTFKKIERSARYAKLQEVGGKPKEIYLAREDLTSKQWNVVRWKTEMVINRKLSGFQMEERQAIGLP